LKPHPRKLITSFSDEYVSTRKKKRKIKKEIYKERKEREKELVNHTICILPFLGTYDTPMVSK